MSRRKKILVASLGTIAGVFVFVGIGAWLWTTSLRAYAEGSTQELANQMFFQVGLLRKLEASSSDADLVRIRQALREHVRLNWESLERRVRSLGVKVKGIERLRDAVGQAISESAERRSSSSAD